MFFLQKSCFRYDKSFKLAVTRMDIWYIFMIEIEHDKLVYVMAKASV